LSAGNSSEVAIPLALRRPRELSGEMEDSAVIDELNCEALEG
jgi:hypothetical protein